ncbi:hypothetical protein [Luteimonas mephitis]|uniref:hypothetical protein n=1 Tax=Luteimonas mephitis TaxID=83615 RepID=UPI003A90CEF1
MQLISSRQTFFFKKVFPVFWFGFLVVFCALAATQGAWKEPAFFIVPLIMAVAGFVMMRVLVRDLADEVLDGGRFLVVRRGGEEERLALSNVINVDMSQFTNPKRLTLRLRKPGRFGSEVVFLPKSGIQLNPLARNKVAEDLIVRADRARSEASSSP